MDNLKEALKAYYSSAIKLYDKWPTFRSSCLKSVKKIKNHSEQYRLIKGTEFSFTVGCDNPLEIKEKLLYNILMNLEEEMEYLKCIRKPMEEELNKLERLCYEVDKLVEASKVTNDDFNSISCVSVLQNKTSTYLYFVGSYSKIKTACKLLNYESVETVDELEAAIAYEDIPPESMKEKMSLAKMFIEES